MQRYRLWMAAGMLVLAVAIGWQLRPADNQDAMVIPCADPTKGCGLSMGQSDQLRIRFDHTPQTLKPFKLSVEAPQAQALHASFAMRGMEMGLNRYRLLQQAPGLWTAEVTLPVCVQGRSDWTMLLELETPSGKQRYQIAFRSA